MNQARLNLSPPDAVGRVTLYHRGRENTSTAYSLGQTARIRLHLPRALGATDVSIQIFDESCRKSVMTVLGEWLGLCEGTDIYDFRINTRKIGVGLYFYRPIITCGFDKLFGYGEKSAIRFSQSPDATGLLQLTVSDFEYDKPSKIYGGTIYHIFVDRFSRGGDVPVSDGAVLVPGEWEQIPEYPECPGAPLKNNTFYGGTLWGIIDKLDYISSLGVSAIYLSPVFQSVSNHKYDTADYMTVDPMFGGDEALASLISECKRRGIEIILDGVFNHTGADSIYFNRYGRFDSLGAYQSRQSPYYSWFDFKDFPSKYTCWWDIEILPRINPDIYECGSYFTKKGGVLDKYSSMGIYGFRLDVADELSDSFISKIKATLSRSGESMLYGEVWEDASNKIAYDTRKKYYLGSELDGVMNYPLRTGIIDYVLFGNTEKLRYALTEVTDNAPPRILNAQMNLLGTHDTERILTVLGGSVRRGAPNSTLASARMTAAERAAAVSRLISAYTLLATLPGVPAIFYGDEAGLEGYHDPFNRMPYPWGRECNELVSHYRKIGKIRKDHTVYREGRFRLHTLTPELLMFSREDRKYSYLTVVNNSKEPIRLTLDGFGRALISEAEGKDFTLLGASAEIYKIKKHTNIEIN